ncbi:MULTISPECIES: hypothetical protein [Brevibacterium]|uniref:Uncharacterized protein n=1 Tax=Brevibacterium antiquum CNRZ 918 TaxID=1255637 RepID=A0A2H1KDT0_9MICO|nr:MULTISPECIES: hypothetical protein [Brevibacterium]SMX97913.1 hypothetical protein BANT918_02371 [Brevibacterium antiquum CNRZ 918]
MDSVSHSLTLQQAFERNQLALSILSHRQDERAVEQAISALKGASVEELMAREGDA